MSTTASSEETPPGAPSSRPATFRDVFAVREFRPLFGTFLLSTAGDELARVALTVLVYQRTSSPLLSAITFAISYLPWIIGGPVLSAIADRLPRHRVLIASDLARAALVAGMAIPGMPLPVMLALLFVVSLLAPPFESARSALMADVLEGDRYAVATSLTNVSIQLSQVVGFVLAGALVAVFDPSAALLIDAATFALSAGWLALRLQRRPAAAGPGEGRHSLWQDTAAGLRFIARTPRLRAIIALLWAGTPFTAELGEGTAAVGVLLGSQPLGVVVGGLVIARFVAPHRRERLVGPMAALSLAPLIMAGALAWLGGPGRLSFGLVLVLMFVAGIGAAWVIPLNVSFVQAVPSAFRGRAFGVAVSGLYGVQGIGALGAGLLAELLAPSGVVAVAGVLGLIAVIAPLISYRRTQPHVVLHPGAAGSSEP